MRVLDRRSISLAIVATLSACGGRASSPAAPVSSPAPSDDLARIELAFGHVYDERVPKVEALCPGAGVQLDIAGFDGPGALMQPSYDQFDIVVTPTTAELELADERYTRWIKIKSPMPEHPETLGQPVVVRATHKQRPSITASMTIPQSLDCGAMTIELGAAAADDGHEGGAAITDANGGAGGDGEDGTSASEAEVEAAEVELSGGKRVILVVAEHAGHTKIAIVRPEDPALALRTSGASGGNGGRGGRGRPGYDSNGDCRAPGPGGRGGNGGSGGDGANLLVRATSKQVLSRLTLEASGGEPGAAGEGGQGGAPCNDSSNDGARGKPGRAGLRRGKPGKVTTKIAPARELSAITKLLGNQSMMRLVEP